tara:strand:- start:5 stop:439 length:435 start_codon:yes stop_codon:yes gene_type:complete
MSTIVGTNIEVTNIKYDSDTTAMIVSSTGGGAGTVPQGLAKQLLYYNMVANSIKSSLNVSSVTDVLAGRIAVNLATGYTSLDDYQVLGFGNCINGDTWHASNTTACKVNWAYTNTSSVYDFTSHSSSGYIDGTYNYAISYGELT